MSNYRLRRDRKRLKSNLKYSRNQWETELSRYKSVIAQLSRELDHRPPALRIKWQMDSGEFPSPRRLMAAGTLKLVGWSGIIDRGFLRQRRYKEWEDCFKRDAIHQMAKYMEKEGFIDFVSEESPAGFVLRSTVLIAKVSSPAGNLQEF